MDIADWLRTLGLDQYEAAFRESGIDVDVLPELNEQHLKDLGVPLGHRLKMLRAIRDRAAATPAALRRTPRNRPGARSLAALSFRHITLNAPGP